jgi:hypothetical protein
LQCERIDALAKELAVAKSKSHLTNDELMKAAGVEEIKTRRHALNKEMWATMTTDKEGRAIFDAALHKKVGALDKQYEQKLAKFLFDLRDERCLSDADVTAPSNSKDHE